MKSRTSTIRKSSMRRHLLSSIATRALPCGALALSVLYPTHAMAQDDEAGASVQLNEIVVTAQKRAESLQDVPLTVQVFSGDSIAKAGVTDIEVLSESMPAITIARSANSQRIVVRGIGSGTNSGFEQSVGTFVDGIYYGRGQQLRPKFIDVASVEALKGPQSTLFGTNVTAGAINVRSNDPTSVLEGRVGLVIGEYGQREVEAVISGPLSDTLMGRVALYKRNFDGFVSNASIGHDVTRERNWGGRAVLLFEPTNNFSIRAAYERHDLDQVGNVAQNVIFADNFLPQAFGDDGVFDFENVGGNHSSLTAIPNGPITDTNVFDTFSFRMSYEGDGFTLTSLTGYTQYDWDNIVDSDYTPVDLLVQQTAQDFEQWSQEFRLETTIAETLDIVAGFYYNDQNFKQLRTSELVASAAGPNVVLSPAQQDTKTWALFTQSTLNLSDVTRMTVGLRYSSDKKEASDVLTMSNPVFQAIGFFGAFEHDVTASRTDKNLSWLFRGEYDFGDDSLLYALASRGYKAGGFDINGLGGSQGTTPATDFEFEDERATNYEIGAKLNLLGGAATLNTSAFYTLYDDLQVTQFNGASFELGNAAGARVQGLEVDYRHAWADGLIFSATATWQDFEFKDYLANCNQRQINGLEAGCVNGAQNLDGKDGQFAPALSANVGIDYEADLSSDLLLKTNLNLIYSSSYYTQLGLDENVQQDSYAKINARIALASADDSWEIALIGRNLTDKKVSINSFDSAISSNFPLTYVKFITPPRQVSLQLLYRF